MVIHCKGKLAHGAGGNLHGSMLIELLVASALLTAALLPLAYSFASEKRMARAAYHRAVATEIVDGEIEILAAGEWRNWKRGSHPYEVHAMAATNLPPGRFTLILDARRARLEWQPLKNAIGPAVIREVALP